MRRYPIRLLERTSLAAVSVAALLLAFPAQADAPPGRYEVEDSTAKDVRTGLVWRRSPSSLPRFWDDAVTYCDNMVEGTDSDWRLPTVAELESLTDVRMDGAPFLDPEAFDPADGNDASARFWSSTVDPGNVLNAYAVGTNMELVSTLKLTALSVRCVRGG